MGKILRTKKLTTFAEGCITGLIIIIIMGIVYYISPGLRVTVSKRLNGLTIDNSELNNITSGDKLPLPSNKISNKVDGNKKIRIAEYAWNGNSGMIVANGGSNTTSGSLMESGGINLEIVRQDMVSGLRDMQLKFVEEFNSGAAYPKSDKSAIGVSIMGDGVPFYITTTQKSLDEKFGKDKYHVQAIASYGLSYGEDKLIGPKIWKDNPQTMRGCVISSVIGDGDWVVACNYAFANKIPVNPDPTTYDSTAINFVPSQDDDFINSVKELIKSQTVGYTIPLKEIKDGKLTGKIINHKIDGATTWTPGDKMAFDALSGFTDVISTKEFVNQMSTTLVIVKEWAIQHEKEVIELLKQTYIACNQIKLYDEWAHKASECVSQTYNFETPEYWYTLFKGITANKNGLEYNIGGTKVFNYADAMQYYGISGSSNRYKAVYDQVSTYLTDLNPCNFNETCPNGVIPYDDAVNLYFLKSINIGDMGKVDEITYTENKTSVLANGQWRIQFKVSSSEISGSTKDLETIYNLLIQAEQTKIKIIGHTDATGNSASNIILSKDRANSVVNYLINRGISRDRFQLIDGKGSSEPISKDNSENRRVEITLLK